MAIISLLFKNNDYSSNNNGLKSIDLQILFSDVKEGLKWH